MDAVTIPVMAKARIGHFVEAQVLEALGVDYIDESEVLTPADELNHIDKHAFKVPFVCGCRDLGEALRRINEGAAMIRTKGEAGTGNIVEAVRHIRALWAGIRQLQGMREDELFVAAKELNAPYQLVKDVAENGKLPVVNFVAGGIATPADAALAMQLGAEGVFVGSGIFKSEDPARTARAIVQATTHFDNPQIIAEVSKGLGAPMAGLEVRDDARQRAARRPRLVARRRTRTAHGPDMTRRTRPRRRRAQSRQDRRARRPGRLRRAHRDPTPARRRRGRRPSAQDLDGLAGLIIPGGESTAMRKLIDNWGLRQPILDLARNGRTDLRHVRRHDPAVERDHRRRRAGLPAARHLASSAMPLVASWKASSRS